MFSTLQRIPIPFLLVLATTLEVGGDAIVRQGIYQHVGFMRVGYFLIGAALLLGYASFLNTAPVDFARIVGLYIATLFVIWQVISYLTFKAMPNAPVKAVSQNVQIGALSIANLLIVQPSGPQGENPKSTILLGALGY